MKILSERITLALEFCALAHKDQKRKNSNIPYASHPSSVGFILHSLGYEEDVVIAGILHDIIEDTIYDEKDIKEIFGEEVLRLVLGVTENKQIKNWHERKKDYLLKIEKGDHLIKVISSADMLDNTRALLREHKKDQNIWQHFGSSKNDLFEFHQKRFETVKDSLSEQFRKELEKILLEFSKIIS